MRYAQIRPTYIPDEQSVAGQHCVRLRIAPVEVVNDEGDRFRSVAGRFEGLQAHASELEDLAIAKRNEYIRCLRRGSQIDFCAYPIAQFQMPSNEIGVEMR